MRDAFVVMCLLGVKLFSSNPGDRIVAINSIIEIACSAAEIMGMAQHHYFPDEVKTYYVNNGGL